MASHPQDEAIRAAVDAKLAELCADFPLGYVPTILWKAYRVTAGMAYYRHGVIGLSTRVLKDEQAAIDTLIHEYAHLLAVRRHGTRAAGHGEPWQRAMRELGQEPKVRHSYEVERNAKRQKVTYTCLKCGRSFERARRLPKRRKYVHANCGGSLKLTSVERVTVGLSDA